MAEKKKSRIKKWIALAVLACLLVIVIQNTETVRTQILFVSLEMPRFVLLAIMLLIGFVIGIFMRDGKKTA